MVEVAGQVEGTIANGSLWGVLDGGTVESETGGIASCGHKTWEDSVIGGIVGGDEQDIDGLSWRAAGQRRATREAGGEGEDEEGEARARGGVE